MLLFLPDSAYSSVHCVCRRAQVWGMFGRCWKEKMLGSHLRALADSRSLGVCSTIAVKPRGPRFFSWSLRITHSTQDCQNLFCHGGGKNRLKGCDTVYWQDGETKSHFTLTFRSNVFTQQFLTCVLLSSKHVYKCVLLSDHT